MRKTWTLLSSNLHEALFGVGLAVLCGSVAQWSPALAGVILGVVLMLVAVWPFLLMMRKP